MGDVDMNTVVRKFKQKVSEKVADQKVSNHEKRRLFGHEIAQVNEKTMQFLEEKIPELAVGALNQAYCNALASGATVLEAVDGALVETAPDGSRKFIQSLPAPYSVKLGSKRIRRAD